MSITIRPAKAEEFEQLEQMAEARKKLKNILGKEKS